MPATSRSPQAPEGERSGFGPRWLRGPYPALLLVCMAAFAVWGPTCFVVMLFRSLVWPAVWCWALFALWSLLLRRYWLVAAGVLGTVICWSAIDHVPATPAVAEEGTGFRIAQMNLLQENRQHAEVARVALATGADAISFQEVDPLWAKALDTQLGSVYPHRRTVAGTNQYGIALYSRVPFVHAEIFDLVGRPAIEARMATDAGELRLFCVHTSSPGDPKAYRERDQQLQELAERVLVPGPPTVVIGDLNAVSWDRALQGFAARTAMGEAPDGPFATWPTLLGKALIPLDHIFVSKELGLSGPAVFRIPGSDHRGLVGDIVQLNSTVEAHP